MPYDARGDSMDANMEDAGDGTVWMTYDELATARGISRASAIRLSFRRKWPRRKGNHSEALVAVPPAAQVPSPDVTHDALPAVMDAVIPDLIHESRDLEALTRERQRADQAEAREATTRIQLDQVTQDREAARIEAALAQGEARALREALAEARRPTWRKWLGLP